MNLFDLDSFLQCGAILSLDRTHVVIGYGPSQWKKEPTANSFYFPDFFLEGASPWLEHLHTERVDLKTLEEVLTTAKQPLPPSLTWESSPYADYEKTVDDLLQRFASGELRKAVPYITERTTSKINAAQILLSLKRMAAFAHKHPVYLYGFWDQHSGLLGATPEVLFKITGSHLETMACAGTRARGCDAGAIADDPKEVREHELVVDDIYEALSPYGKIHIGKREVRPFNQLVHLVTEIRLEMKHANSFEQLVTAMHPTAALGVIPRQPGRHWLAAYGKTMPRGRYGAPVGFIGSDQSICLVGIRNMQWDNQGAKVMAGGGVVPGSTPEREWGEIQLKLKAIKELLSV